MKKKGPTKNTTDRFNFAFRRNRLRRKVDEAIKSLRITAPAVKKDRGMEEIEPLGEKEFEEEMQKGFKRDK